MVKAGQRLENYLILREHLNNHAKLLSTETQRTQSII